MSYSIQFQFILRSFGHIYTTYITHRNLGTTGEIGLTAPTRINIITCGHIMRALYNEMIKIDFQI